jgi:hypothetical protein
MAMSEAELVAYLDQSQPCYAHAAWHQEELLEARMRQGSDAASEAYLDLGSLEEERLESLEYRLLLVAGSVCVQAGHPELWSTIWRIWHAGELDHEDEFEALREMTARARAGERSLVDEAAWLGRLRSG